MTDRTAYSDQDVFESLALREWEPDAEKDNYDLERRHLEAGNVRLWFPAADRAVEMPTRGFYPGKWPLGAIVHFTAGRSEGGDRAAAATATYGASQGHCYFCISKTGRIYQTAPLDRWGSHAGQSEYPGLGSSVSTKLVGIEVCNAGQLRRKSELGYEPYWNKPGDPKNTYYSEAEVRQVAKKDNILVTGTYHKYTPEQEASLIELLLWMHAQQPGIFKLDYVLGHDEVSPRRKDDPGGSLSMTMPEFRALLKARATSAVATVAATPAAVAAATAPIGGGPGKPAAPQTGDIKVGPQFLELLAVYRAAQIEFPHLKDITFAQWAHESGYGSSKLAMLHRNFAGMKWRADMSSIAHKVFYKPAHDPVDTEYCGFAKLEDFVKGYWHRLDLRTLDYSKRDGGWRMHNATAGDFIDFVGPIWAPEGGDNSPLNNGYIKKVKSVLERLGRAGLLPSSGGQQVAQGETPVNPMERAAARNALLDRLLQAARCEVPDKDAMSHALRALHEAMARGEANLSSDDASALIGALVATQAISRPERSGADLLSLIDEIEKASRKMPPDLLSLNHAAEALHAELGGLPRQIDRSDLKRLIDGLRSARAFDWLSRICDRLILTGHQQPIVRRYYAQGLVDGGQIAAGIDSLEALKREELGKDDLDEVMGLLGRAHKQIYVNHVRTPADAYASGHRFAGHLREAIRYYGMAFDPQRPAASHWHGINLVALAKRAEVDGVRLEPRLDADAIARSMITALEPTAESAKDVWALATLADAHLALRQYDRAEHYFQLFARSEKIDAFKLAGSIRQLEEVWRAEGGEAGARGCLLTLKAGLAGKRYSEFTLTSAERKLIRSENFETSYPDGQFLKHSLLRRIVRAGECIAWIKDRHLNGIGSGFLIVGSDLAPSLGGDVYLLTNTHVVCDPEWPGVEMHDGALRPDEALVQFEAIDEAMPRTYRLEHRAVWLSPSSECDACLLRFKEQPSRVMTAKLAHREHPITFGKEDDDADGTPVAVLGHAGGRELQLGIRGTLVNHQGSIIDIGPRHRSVTQPVYLHYDAPTLGGNSGSPVFDTTTWEVVGLHHAGYDTVNGRARLRGRGGYHFANEGIFIHSIGEAVEEHLRGGKRRSVLPWRK